MEYNYTEEAHFYITDEILISSDSDSDDSTDSDYSTSDSERESDFWDYDDLVKYRKKQINQVKEKEPIEKKNHSKFIHEIASLLFQKYLVITKCLKELPNEEYEIKEGKTYEILAIDYRIDDNYILMREYNNDPLFYGDMEKANDLTIKSSNYFEYLRRGYFDCDEEFILHMIVEEKLKYIDEPEKVRSEIEIEKEFKKGVIEIPVSLFNNYFGEIIKPERKQQFQIHNESFVISGKYTLVKIKFNGNMKMKMKPPEGYSMIIWIYEKSLRSLIIKQNIDEHIPKIIQSQFISHTNMDTYVDIVIEMLSEYKIDNNYQLKVDIEFEYDNHFKVRKNKYYIDYFDLYLNKY